jgi:hypothetical protein
MAITKTRITSSLNRAVFKITATTAADTITLALATDFTHNGQTVSSPKVNIANLSFSCAATGDISISRGGVVTHKLFGTAETFHAPSDQNNTSDIVITFTGTAGGTLIIDCGKVEGFGAINPPGLPY